MTTIDAMPSGLVAAANLGQPGAKAESPGDGFQALLQDVLHVPSQRDGAGDASSQNIAGSLDKEVSSAPPALSSDAAAYLAIIGSNPADRLDEKVRSFFSARGQGNAASPDVKAIDTIANKRSPERTRETPRFDQAASAQAGLLLAGVGLVRVAQIDVPFTQGTYGGQGTGIAPGAGQAYPVASVVPAEEDAGAQNRIQATAAGVAPGAFLMSGLKEASARLAAAMPQSQTDAANSRIPLQAELVSLERATHHAVEAPDAQLATSIDRAVMKAIDDTKPSGTPALAEALQEKPGLARRTEMEGAEVSGPSAGSVRPVAAVPRTARPDRIESTASEQAPMQSTPPVVAQVANAVLAAASRQPAAAPASNGGTMATQVLGGTTLDSAAGIADASPSSGDEIVKSLRVRLHPADMGQVDVRLALQGDSLRVHVRFETAQAAQDFKLSQADISQALSNHGLRLEGLVIDNMLSSRPGEDSGAPPTGAASPSFDAFAGSAGSGQPGSENARRGSRGSDEEIGRAVGEITTAEDRPSRRTALFV